MYSCRSSTCLYRDLLRSSRVSTCTLDLPVALVGTVQACVVDLSVQYMYVLVLRRSSTLLHVDLLYYGSTTCT